MFFLGLALRLTQRFVPTYLCVRVCETNLFFFGLMCSVHVDHSTRHMLGWNVAHCDTDSTGVILSGGISHYMVPKSNCLYFSSWNGNIMP